MAKDSQHTWSLFGANIGQMHNLNSFRCEFLGEIWSLVWGGEGGSCPLLFQEVDQTNLGRTRIFPDVYPGIKAWFWEMTGLVCKPVLYLLLQKNAGSLRSRGVASEHVFVQQLHITLHASSSLLAVCWWEGNRVRYLVDGCLSSGRQDQGSW